MRSFLSFSFLFCFLSSFGQLEKTIHQTFPVGQAQEINLDLFGAYEVLSWAGDHILTETNIRLFEATEGIMEHFLKSGRYAIEIDSSQTEKLVLIAQDKERKTIKTKKGTCEEQVELKVYVPDVFAIDSKQKMVRKLPDAIPD